MRKIPFDNVVVTSVVAELQAWIGAKIQDVRHPTVREVYFELFGPAGRAVLVISCDTLFYRLHLATRMPSNAPQPSPLLSTLRSKLIGARITRITQVETDRIVRIDLDGNEGIFTIIAELMGQHSNLVLLDGDGRAVGAMRWIGSQKSVRPVTHGAVYVLPPSSGVGRSTLYRELIAAGGGTDTPASYWSPGYGVYPLSLATLGYKQEKVLTISEALERHFREAVRAFAIEQKQTSLASQLRRLISARDAAISELNAAIEAGLHATTWQKYGDLLLAFGYSLPVGAHKAEVWDYEGDAITIPLDAELDGKLNAQRYYEKAKRAKGRLEMAHQQRDRLQADRDDILALLAEVEQVERLDELEDLEAQAKKRRWLQAPNLAQTKKEERPFEGHRVRQLFGPRGILVLYGENAEANDYLTLRVAKPNDYWLHVRGHTSAHVVIRTDNQPDRVQSDQLQFAARVALQNSPMKHSGFVSIDYTLKKYVRKPRGAAKGTALYTHEKTLNLQIEE